MLCYSLYSHSALQSTNYRYELVQHTAEENVSMGSHPIEVREGHPKIRVVPWMNSVIKRKGEAKGKENLGIIPCAREKETKRDSAGINN